MILLIVLISRSSNQTLCNSYICNLLKRKQDPVASPFFPLPFLVNIKCSFWRHYQVWNMTKHTPYSNVFFFLFFTFLFPKQQNYLNSYMFISNQHFFPHKTTYWFSISNLNHQDLYIYMHLHTCLNVRVIFFWWQDFNF